jgi:predicted  nucleic acid-binding Zn-ribbon protein
MSGLTEVFREIHRLRLYARGLQEQIDRVPIQRKAQLARVARHEEMLRQGQEEVRHFKVAIHEKEVSLKAAHTQIAKHQRQLNEAGSKKEYDALKLEISNEQQTCRRLEDEILDVMAQSEEKAAGLPELEQAVRMAKEEYGRYEQGVEERVADLRAQLEEARRQLQEAEAQVPEEVRPQFNRLTAAMGADALAAVPGRTCSACHTGITAQNYNDLQIGRFLVCKSCGRVLYLATG